ncbi:hypothetical protein KGF54_000948 [Candida jiufengensis]|uniref:uncharacterized protein n=1 Tax=Candida jiufengensis TaxID=497108 RepID=UPI00222465B9|nr:uncharacterized protein KGF54_000948 [Candida jiufengensis]KAI5956473.1 hypothetical protein KGF54_000948 [Candida jiufengensis]
MTKAKVKVKKFLDKLIQPQLNNDNNKPINKSNPNYNPYTDNSSSKSLNNYNHQNDIEEIPSLSYSSLSSKSHGEFNKNQDITISSIKPSSVEEPPSVKSEISSIKEVINYRNNPEINQKPPPPPKPNFLNNHHGGNKYNSHLNNNCVKNDAQCIKRNIINNSFDDFLNNQNNRSSTNANLKKKLNSQTIQEESDDYDFKLFQNKLELDVEEEEDDFYSAIKVDKFRFSTRGTLLNYKRGKNHQSSSGSDSNEKSSRVHKNSTNKNQYLPHTKRRRRRKRNEGLKFKASQFHFTEEDEEEEKGIDEYDLHDNSSLVSITTTATVATTTTTTTTTTTAHQNNIGFTNLTTALSSTSVFETTTTAIGTPGSPLIPLNTPTNPVSNNKTSTTRTRTTTTATSFQRTTTQKTLNSQVSQRRRSSSIKQSNNLDNYKVNIIPDIASYQASFLRQNSYSSTHAYRENEQLNRGKDRPKLNKNTIEDDAGSVSGNSIYQHRQVESKKISSCMIHDDSIKASFSSHASIKDNESSNVEEFESYDIDYLLNHLTFDTDEDKSKLIQEAQEEAIVEDGLIQESQQVETAVDGQLNSHGSEHSTSSSNFQNDDHRWFNNVKDKFHYYNNKLKKIKLHTSHSNTTKQTNEVSNQNVVSSILSPVTLHSNDVTSNDSQDQDSNNTKSTLKLSNVKQQPSDSSKNQKSSSSQILQPTFYSHENKQSSKINVVQKSRSSPNLIPNGTDHKNELKLNGSMHVESKESKEEKEELFIISGTNKIKGEDLSGAIYYIQNEQKDEVIKQMTFMNGSQQNLVKTTINQQKHKSHYQKYQNLQNLKQIKNHSFYKVYQKQNLNGSIYQILENEQSKFSNNENRIIPKIVELDISNNASSCGGGDSLQEYSSNDGDDEQSFNELESKLSI